MATVYRGVSFTSDSGCYYTESKQIAATYAGWRSGSDCEQVVCVEINPVNIFNANSPQGMNEAQKIATVQGWDFDDVAYFSNYYSNKPKSAFVGLVLACWRSAKFAGTEITNEEAETIAKAALKSAGYDAVQQVEKGGAKFPDGSIQLATKKATAWIVL